MTIDIEELPKEFEIVFGYKKTYSGRHTNRFRCTIFRMGPTLSSWSGDGTTRTEAYLAAKDIYEEDPR